MGEGEETLVYEYEEHHTNVVVVVTLIILGINVKRYLVNQNGPTNFPLD